MSPTNLEVVRGIYDALNRGDIDAALDSSDDQLVHDWSRSVGPYQGVYRGREEVRAFWHTVEEATSELTFDVEEVFGEGSHVVAKVGVSMRGRGSGALAVGRAAHLWALRDGRVVSFTLFERKEDALDAVGGG
jgi:ketosteroid isomerase-like protein